MNKSFLNNFLDTTRLSRRLFPQKRYHRLCDLIERFGMGDAVEYRALADVEHTNWCYLYMKQHMEENAITAESLLPTKNGFSVKNIQASTNDFDKIASVYEKVFVCTGLLERMMRKEAMQLVVDCGGLRGHGSIRKLTSLFLATRTTVPPLRMAKAQIRRSQNNSNWRDAISM